MSREKNLLRNLVYPLSLCQLASGCIRDQGWFASGDGEGAFEHPTTHRDAKSQGFGLAHFKGQRFPSKNRAVGMPAGKNVARLDGS